MDELKHRILGLLNKQTTKIPSMGFSDANYHFPPETLSINSRTAPESNRPADQDILESIEAAYFSLDPKFDICRFELTKLPESLDCDQIQRDFKHLKQQHQVVSKKVLQLILEHQNACNEEFGRMTEIHGRIEDALGLCRGGRARLTSATAQFDAGLRILGAYRKRKLAQNLLANLRTIKDLHNFDRRTEELLETEDYAGAIGELKRCQRLATRYRHFNCVAALTYRLQETLDGADERLDRVLEELCYHFDGMRYKQLRMAYDLLEKSAISLVDNLHMHYINAIYYTSLKVVRSYANEYDINDNSQNLYKTLCQNIPNDTFIPCLLHLCRHLFKIVLSYHQLVRWHDNDTEDGANLELNQNRQKLELNLMKIWDDIQRKVSNLLLNVQLADYKFDQFVQVLGVVHRLMQVGEEFCSSRSDDLQESIRRQSVVYFQNYHTQRLDELRIFVENEMWEICPVKPTFNLLQLQEYKPLRGVMKNTQRTIIQTQSISDGCSSGQSQDGSCTTVGNYFVRYADRGTPFDGGLDETTIEEDILYGGETEPSGGYFTDESDDDDVDEIDDELKRDCVLEEGVTINRHAHKRLPKSLILTNTSLTIMRQMGKYLQMSRLLKSIAYQIVASMNQLFDFYLYSIHTFFTSDLSVASSTLYSNELSAILKKCDDWIGEKPQLSPLVNFEEADQLHGLSERIVGVESLIFLSRQYEFLRDYLETLIPTANKIMLQQFYTQNIPSAIDLRCPIYMSVAARAFDLRKILVGMSKINWEVRDVMSQHNSYIDLILREVQIFALRLDTIGTRVPISDDVTDALWRNVAHIITHTLVQGFADARRCTNGGRALMQLDFTQFLSKFEKISGLKPVPHREYVENYVKAYYLPENELEQWIKDHQEYSTKHLYGLVSCACQNNKKTRQRLLQIVEELQNDNR